MGRRRRVEVVLLLVLSSLIQPSVGGTVAFSFGESVCRRFLWESGCYYWCWFAFMLLAVYRGAECSAACLSVLTEE